MLRGMTFKAAEFFRVSLGPEQVVLATKDPRVAERLLRLYSATPRAGRKGRPYRMQYSWAPAYYPTQQVQALYKELLAEHEAYIKLADLI